MFPGFSAGRLTTDAKMVLMVFVSSLVNPYTCALWVADYLLLRLRMLLLLGLVFGRSIILRLTYLLAYRLLFGVGYQVGVADEKWKRL